MSDELIQGLIQLESKIQHEFRILHEKLEKIQGQIEESAKKLSALEARSAMKICILCPLVDNLDGHSSFRCTVYPDLVSKVQRLTELGKCTRCLKACNGQCEEKCTKCVGPHNFLLCGKESGGFKRSRNNVLRLLTRQFTVFSINEHDDTSGFTDLDSEVYHLQTPSGKPPHRLQLKKGAVVILLRNLYLFQGWLAEQESLLRRLETSCKQRNIVYPYPVSIAPCLLYNVQSGTVAALGKDRADIANPLLYVALSRVRTAKGLLIFDSADNRSQTNNVVFRDALA